MQQLFAELMKADATLRVLQNAAFRDRDMALTERLLALGRPLADLIAEVDRLRQEFRDPVESYREAAASRAVSRAGQDSPSAEAVATYPRFFREGEKLVKLGWSEKKAAEYRHACPIRDAFPFATRLADASRAVMLADGSRGRIIPLVKLQPIENSRGGVLSNHCLYATLDWLLAEGLVTRHGQQGYSWHGKAEDIMADLRRRWEALPALDEHRPG